MLPFENEIYIPHLLRYQLRRTAAATAPRSDKSCTNVKSKLRLRLFCSLAPPPSPAAALRWWRRAALHHGRPARGWIREPDNFASGYTFGLVSVFSATFAVGRDVAQINKWSCPPRTAV